jgi:hypothetical protein
VPTGSGLERKIAGAARQERLGSRESGIGAHG